MKIINMHKGIKMLMAAGLALLALGSCQKEDYKIQSNPDEFAVFPLAVPVAAEGGEYTLNITGHEDWTIKLADSNTSAEGWCTLSQTSGSGAADVTLTVTQSTSFVKNRQIVIEVSNGIKTLRSKVIQKTLTLGENEVLINGMVWSTVNLNNPGEFCSSPDEVGMYYQFNSDKPWPSKGEQPVPGWATDDTVFDDIKTWAPENDPCPEGWRVPTSDEFIAVWEKGQYKAQPAQTGFQVWGMILGLSEADAKAANKDNLKALGGLFIPNSGWINEAGNYDRTWLACVRHGNSLSATHGGLYLSDGGYTDQWGWGDGQKGRASSVRCVMDLQIED